MLDQQVLHNGPDADPSDSNGKGEANPIWWVGHLKRGSALDEGEAEWETTEPDDWLNCTSLYELGRNLAECLKEFTHRLSETIFAVGERWRQRLKTAMQLLEKYTNTSERGYTRRMSTYDDDEAQDERRSDPA